MLISADTTAHLADFESVREECTGASKTYSRSASRSGSAVATRKYEAPEMRAGTVPKATAASDMYSYGVCALLACCDESSGVVFNAETEALQSWDRERAHAKGGPHLPSLLDELLDLDGPPASSAAAAVGRRISAREVLRRPFLDPAAEREQARLETEAAAAASHEAGEQLAAVNREAVSKQREAEWQEAERRRVWEEKKLEQERALRSARLEAAVSKAKIEGRQRQLESQRRALAQQEAAAKQAEAAAAKAEAQGETARRAAKEEAAKLRAKTEEQRQKLAADKAREEADTEKRKGELKRQQAKVEEELKRLEQHKQAPPLIAHAQSCHTPHTVCCCSLPSPLSCSLPALSDTLMPFLAQRANALPGEWKHTSDQGFSLQPIHRGQGVWAALAACLKTRRADWLGEGRDVPPGHPPYNRLELARAWRIENPKLWRKFCERKREVADEVGRARHAGGTARRYANRSVAQFEQPPDSQLHSAASRLPGTLRSDVNETRLLHGTKPAALLSVLSGGPNERYSGGIFGSGTCAHGLAQPRARPQPLFHAVSLSAPADLAADAGKNDQYTYDKNGRNDQAYNDHPELHSRLYSDSHRHPDRRKDGIFGNVYYVLVCRAALGSFAVSRDGRTTVEGEPLFPFTDRELRPITGVSPPVHHHALVGETATGHERYREFIVFHGDSLYPEYLLAYHRAA